MLSLIERLLNGDLRSMKQLASFHFHSHNSLRKDRYGRLSHNASGATRSTGSPAWPKLIRATHRPCRLCSGTTHSPDDIPWLRAQRRMYSSVLQVPGDTLARCVTLFPITFTPKLYEHMYGHIHDEQGLARERFQLRVAGTT